MKSDHNEELIEKLTASLLEMTGYAVRWYDHIEMQFGFKIREAPDIGWETALAKAADLLGITDDEGGNDIRS